MKKATLSFSFARMVLTRKAPIVIGAFLLCLIVALSSCGPETPKIKVGEKAFIYEQSLSAATLKDFEVLTDLSVAKDETALKAMLLSGKASILDAYVNVKVLDVKFAKVFVETEDGTRVWVASDVVKPIK